MRVELPANMPEIDADPGMLERVIANIVENAVKYAPDSDIVVVGAAGGLSPATLGGRPAGELRIIDHGRGVPAERVLDMFRPFQRLDDAPQATGVGLGPGRGEGVHRGDGRTADRGADTGRRPDHGHHGFRSPPATPYDPGTAPRPRSSRSRRLARRGHRRPVVRTQDAP